MTSVYNKKLGVKINGIYITLINETLITRRAKIVAAGYFLLLTTPTARRHNAYAHHWLAFVIAAFLAPPRVLAGNGSIHIGPRRRG